MLSAWAIFLFTFPYVVAIPTGSMIVYSIWVCLLFLCFSGVFVLMPAATGRIFGPDYMAVNYGMVFSAFVSFFNSFRVNHLESLTQTMLLS